MSILNEAEFWVAIGLLIFIGILIRAKVPGMAAKALDARGVKIQAELDEALRLREEAHALLEQVKAERVAAEKLAAEILSNAVDDAKQMRADAEAKLHEQIERRRAMAERRIANAETQAALEVKAAAVDAAATLAEAVLTDRLKGLSADPLVDRAVGELAGKLQ